MFGEIIGVEGGSGAGAGAGVDAVVATGVGAET